ncbi:hypothetical protein COP2_047567 [Malus domestica]
MRLATSSFLSITDLARVVSKSLKGHEPCDSPSTAPQRHNPRPQPHKLPLVLVEQLKTVVPATISPRPMPSRLLAHSSRHAAPPRRLPRGSTIQEEDKEN